MIPRQSLALIRGRMFVDDEDIEAVAAPVLRHRLSRTSIAKLKALGLADHSEALTLVPRGKARSCFEKKEN